MKLRGHDTDLWAGVVFVAIGISALALGAGLTVGTAADMGEGYVPRAMAVLLVAFGTLLLLLRLRSGPPPRESSPAAPEGAPVRWRPLVFVTTAVIVFALALEPLGLLAATAGSVVAANFAGRPLSAPALLLLVGVLSAIVAAVFVWGLGLPLQLIP